MTTFIQLPSNTTYWGDPVATAALLPAEGLLYEFRYVADTSSLYYFDGVTWILWLSASGVVSGPGASTDNAVVRWNGAGGTAIQNSVVIVGDTGNVTGVADLTVTGTTTLAAALTGVAHLTAGVVSASAVVLTSEVSGVLPVANGGTNSSAALANGLVMRSAAGAVVESTVTLDGAGAMAALASVNTLVARVGSVGSPAADTALDVDSTTGALLVPRMTTAQKTALNATEGMVLYDTDLGKIQCYEAPGQWNDLTGWGS